MTGGPVSGRFRLTSPTTALVLGVVLVLMAAEVPLARGARQSVNASGGSVPVWFSAAFGVAGFVVAWRKPRNPLGWVILAMVSTGPATTPTRPWPRSRPGCKNAVALDVVQDDLAGVVHQALELAHVSVWISPRS